MRIHLAGEDAAMAAIRKSQSMQVHLAGEGAVMDFVAKALSMKVNLADNGMGRFIISLMAGHPYRLVSYWYLRKLKDPKGALDLLTSGGASIIVDSDRNVAKASALSILATMNHGESGIRAR